jgi:pimeloyl-ACP methyl ester carboxylesterase
MSTDERVEYDGASGNRLVGLLTTPVRKQSRPATKHGRCAVLLHGGMANKNSFYHRELARGLAEELGYSVLRYDATGNGESGPIVEEPHAQGAPEQCRNMMSGFMDDVSDLACTVRWLQAIRGLTVEVAIGHSRGAQVTHIFAAQHPELGVARIIGTNMRWDLSYWRTTWEANVQAHGHWTLKWKNRGQELAHTVTAKDIEAYTSVPLESACRSIRAKVLNCYGVLESGAASGRAGYDTGEALLSDGVVPFTDVEGPANAIADHTLRFLSGVGHFYRETGAATKLWTAVREWLEQPPIGSTAAPQCQQARL